MSWQVAAFAILAVALASGFAWYERARPDARIVALVATLAAFAALGRVAFAAIPNVKPTTDIVLASGYALGGGPGFAVGALAGLVSNFFFGQGPWTPWQMAGWGATGVIGAGLAVVTRRRIGRWPLAVACAVVGFGFTVLQDVGDWVTYSDHSLAQLEVYVGKGIGFDFVHAAGCLVFALAFGPALIRSLGRFTARLQVTWRPVGGAGARAALLLLCAGWLAGQPGLKVGVARAEVRAVARAEIQAAAPGGRLIRHATRQSHRVTSHARVASATSPAAYLLSAQNPDGGFGSAPGQASSSLFSGWAALGLAAAGQNPQDVTRGGHSLIDYIRATVGSASDPGSIERTVLAVRASGLSATSFGGRNLVGALESDVRRNGSVSGQVNLTAFAVLALRAAGVAPGSATLSWLVRQQDADGGFSFATRGGSSDVDDTGSALEALAGAAGSSAARARARAVRFIRGQQNSDGGFPSQPGTDSNAQSTAFAVQGLIAAGVDPNSLRRRGASPLDYLRSLIAGDGHVRYARAGDQTPVWVTAQALMALDGKPLPLAPVARRVRSEPPRKPARSATVPRPRRVAPAPVRKAHRVVSPRHARPAAVPAPPGTTTALDRLAVDAGVLTALMLAPLGQG